MKAHVLYLCALSSAIMYSAEARSFLYSNTLGDNTSLVEINQAFESESQPALFLEQAASILNYPKVAGVYFITNDKGQVFSGIGSGNGGGMEFEDPTAEQCKGEGYKYDSSSCPNGNPADVCPYNSSYFKECCEKSYSYTSENCSLLDTTSSCGNKYKCDCTPESYPVTINSCAAPQIPATGSGKSCTVNGQVRYTECVCPESYEETCSGTNVQGKGMGCSKNGSTKFVSCECKSGYTQTCSSKGNSPKNTSDFCELNGIKYYKECDVCPFNCSVTEKKTGVKYEHEVCSDKYCAIGCNEDEGYINYCAKPETDCVKLGYTKSVSQCPYGYLACPYNSMAVFCDD